jgi:rhodanese-related sulfurtransferase
VVVGGSEDYQLIDVRPAAHYALGHIEGAINLPWGPDWATSTVLDQLDDGLTQIVVCHTGHRASYLTLYLRQLGFDAYALKFGMMGWTTDTDVIGIASTYCTAGAGDYATVTEATDATTGDLPVIDSENTGDELIMELVGAYIGLEQTPIIGAADISIDVIGGGSEDYYMVDVRPADTYDDHIEGAVSLPFTTWTDKSVLESIPIDKKIVTICFTGHTASQAAMVLNQVGYEAYAMAYSMMGWTDDTDVIGNPGVCTCDVDYPTVTD